MGDKLLQKDAFPCTPQNLQPNKKRPRISHFGIFWGIFEGANERTRTADLLITSFLFTEADNPRMWLFREPSSNY